MLEQLRTTTEQDSMWPSWSKSSSVHRFSISDPDLVAMLMPLINAIGADGVILTDHREDSREDVVLERLGCVATDADLANELLDAACRFIISGPGIDDTRLGGGWLTRSWNGDGLHLIRLPVRSARAQSRVLLSLVYRRTATKDNALVAALSSLSPLIDAYLRLWQRSRRQARTLGGLRDAINLASVGTILIDRTSKIGFANSQALELLDAGTLVRRCGSSFAAVNLGDAMKLQVAIGHAVAENATPRRGASPSRGSAMLKLRGRNRTLIVTVVPCEEPAIESDAIAATILLLDPAGDLAQTLQPVCKLHGLSPVETQLASLIAGGASLQAAAERMHVKEQTARTYLKQIFSKTGAGRQSDLVRILLTSLSGARAMSRCEVF